MAKMYPSRLPDRILDNSKMKGEIETFEALSKLPDEFEIFYNRCANAGGTTRVFERKIDFIIIHEQLGLLAMEVKGGKIRIGNDGGFEQYHHNKNKWASIDPYTQVKMALRELIAVVKSDSPKYWIPDEVCVLFPGTYRRDLTDQPQSLPAGTLCADDVPILANLIPTFFSKSRKGPAWGRDVFIDIRRRLQNMPEAKLGSNLSNDRPKTIRQEVEPEARKDGGKALREVKIAASKSNINYQPSTHSASPTTSLISEKSKLEWWEIMLAIMTPIVAFFIVFWFFSNLNIHRPL